MADPHLAAIQSARRRNNPSLGSEAPSTPQARVNEAARTLASASNNPALNAIAAAQSRRQRISPQTPQAFEKDFTNWQTGLQNINAPTEQAADRSAKLGLIYAPSQEAQQEQAARTASLYEQGQRLRKALDTNKDSYTPESYQKTAEYMDRTNRALGTKKASESLTASLGKVQDFARRLDEENDTYVAPENVSALWDRREQTRDSLLQEIQTLRSDLERNKKNYDEEFYGLAKARLDEVEAGLDAMAGASARQLDSDYRLGIRDQAEWDAIHDPNYLATAARLTGEVPRTADGRIDYNAVTTRDRELGAKIQEQERRIKAHHDWEPYTSGEMSTGKALSDLAEARNNPFSAMKQAGDSLSRLVGLASVSPETLADKDAREADLKEANQLKYLLEAQRNLLLKNAVAEKRRELMKRDDWNEISRYGGEFSTKNATDWLTLSDGSLAYAVANGQGDPDETRASVYNLNLQHLGSQEKQLLNAIYHTEGSDAAYQFAQYLNPEMNRRERQEWQKDFSAWLSDTEDAWGKLAQNHPTTMLAKALIASGIYGDKTELVQNRLDQFVSSATRIGKGTAASVATVPANLLKIIALAGQGIDYLDDGYIDQNANYNKFSYMPSDVRNEISRQITESGPAGGVGSFFYQTGMSMADFLFNALVTGGLTGGGLQAVNPTLAENVTLGIMGTAAAADAVTAARDQGLDSTRAMVLGIISGFAEYITEKVSLETLLNANLADKNWTYWLKNAVAEGSEEGASDAINWLADGLYDILSGQEQSEWKRKIREYRGKGLTEQEAFARAVEDRGMELLQDVGGGMLSGGLMAGGSVMSMRSGDLAKGLDITWNLNPQDALDEQIKRGLSFADGTDANRLAQRLASELESGDILSRKKLTRMAGRMARVNELTLVEMADSEALKTALDAVHNGEKVTEEQAKAILADDDARTLLTRLGVLQLSELMMADRQVQAVQDAVETMALASHFALMDAEDEGDDESWEDADSEPTYNLDSIRSKYQEVRELANEYQSVLTTPNVLAQESYRELMENYRQLMKYQNELATLLTKETVKAVDKTVKELDNNTTAALPTEGKTETPETPKPVEAKPAPEEMKAEPVRAELPPLPGKMNAANRVAYFENLHRGMFNSDPTKDLLSAYKDGKAEALWQGTVYEDRAKFADAVQAAYQAAGIEGAKSSKAVAPYQITQLYAQAVLDQVQNRINNALTTEDETNERRDQTAVPGQRDAAGERADERGGSDQGNDDNAGAGEQSNLLGSERETDNRPEETAGGVNRVQQGTSEGEGSKQSGPRSGEESVKTNAAPTSATSDAQAVVKKAGYKALSNLQNVRTPEQVNAYLAKATPWLPEFVSSMVRDLDLLVLYTKGKVTTDQNNDPIYGISIGRSVLASISNQIRAVNVLGTDTTVVHELVHSYFRALRSLSTPEVYRKAFDQMLTAAMTSLGLNTKNDVKAYLAEHYDAYKPSLGTLTDKTFEAYAEEMLGDLANGVVAEVPFASDLSDERKEAFVKLSQELREMMATGAKEVPALREQTVKDMLAALLGDDTAAKTFRLHTGGQTKGEETPANEAFYVTPIPTLHKDVVAASDFQSIEDEKTGQIKNHPLWQALLDTQTDLLRDDDTLDSYIYRVMYNAGGKLKFRWGGESLNQQELLQKIVETYPEANPAQVIDLAMQAHINMLRNSAIDHTDESAVLLKGKYGRLYNPKDLALLQKRNITQADIQDAEDVPTDLADAIDTARDLYLGMLGMPVYTTKGPIKWTDSKGRQFSSPVRVVGDDERGLILIQSDGGQSPMSLAGAAVVEAYLQTGRGKNLYSIIFGNDKGKIKKPGLLDSLTVKAYEPDGEPQLVEDIGRTMRQYVMDQQYEQDLRRRTRSAEKGLWKRIKEHAKNARQTKEARNRYLNSLDSEELLQYADRKQEETDEIRNSLPTDPIPQSHMTAAAIEYADLIWQMDFGDELYDAKGQRIAEVKETNPNPSKWPEKMFPYIALEYWEPTVPRFEDQPARKEKSEVGRTIFTFWDQGGVKVYAVVSPDEFRSLQASGELDSTDSIAGVSYVSSDSEIGKQLATTTVGRRATIDGKSLSLESVDYVEGPVDLDETEKRRGVGRRVYILSGLVADPDLAEQMLGRSENGRLGYLRKANGDIIYADHGIGETYFENAGDAVKREAKEIAERTVRRGKAKKSTNPREGVFTPMKDTAVSAPISPRMVADWSAANGWDSFREDKYKKGQLYPHMASNHLRTLALVGTAMLTGSPSAELRGTIGTQQWDALSNAAYKAIRGTRAALYGDIRSEREAIKAKTQLGAQENTEPGPNRGAVSEDSANRLNGENGVQFGALYEEEPLASKRLKNGQMERSGLENFPAQDIETPEKRSGKPQTSAGTNTRTNNTLKPIPTKRLSEVDVLNAIRRYFPKAKTAGIKDAARIYKTIKDRTIRKLWYNGQWMNLQEFTKAAAKAHAGRFSQNREEQLAQMERLYADTVFQTMQKEQQDRIAEARKKAQQTNTVTEQTAPPVEQTEERPEYTDADAPPETEEELPVAPPDRQAESKPAEVTEAPTPGKSLPPLPKPLGALTQKQNFAKLFVEQTGITASLKRVNAFKNGALHALWQGQVYNSKEEFETAVRQDYRDAGVKGGTHTGELSGSQVDQLYAQAAVDYAKSQGGVETQSPVKLAETAEVKEERRAKEAEEAEEAEEARETKAAKKAELEAPDVKNYLTARPVDSIARVTAIAILSQEGHDSDKTEVRQALQQTRPLNKRRLSQDSVRLLNELSNIMRGSLGYDLDRVELFNRLFPKRSTTTAFQYITDTKKRDAFVEELFYLMPWSEEEAKQAEKARRGAEAKDAEDAEDAKLSRLGNLKKRTEAIAKLAQQPEIGRNLAQKARRSSDSMKTVDGILEQLRALADRTDISPEERVQSLKTLNTKLALAAAESLNITGSALAELLEKMSKAGLLHRQAAQNVIKNAKLLEQRREAIERENGPITIVRNVNQPKNIVEWEQNQMNLLKQGWRNFRRAWETEELEIELLSRRELTNGPTAWAYSSLCHGAATTVQTILQDGLVDKAGNRIGDSLTDVVLCRDEKGRFNEEQQLLFQRYLVLRANQDRMSLESRAMDLLDQFVDEHPDIADLSTKESAATAAMTQKEAEVAGKAKLRDLVLQYVQLSDQALKTTNKPVLAFDDTGDDVDAETSKIRADEMEALYPWLKEKADALYNWTDKFMQAWAVGDRLSRESYEQWKELYPHYVPLYRVFPDGTEISGPRGKTHISSQGLYVEPVSRTAKGSSKYQVNNIEDNMARKVNAIVQGGRNQELINHIGRLAMTDDGSLYGDLFALDWDAVRDGELYTDSEGRPLNTVAAEDIFDETLSEETKLSDVQAATDYKHRGGSMTAWINGNPVKILLSPGMYQSMAYATKSVHDRLDRLTKAGNQATKLMKTAITGINPNFALKNPIRDIPTAIVNSESGIAILKYMALAIRDMYEAGVIDGTLMAKLADKIRSMAGRVGVDLPSKSGVWAVNADHWKNFVALGGTHANQWTNEKGFVQQMNLTPGWRGAVKRGWAHMKDAAGALNNATESMTRFAEYLATLDRVQDRTGEYDTYSARIQGIKNAAEVTVDFSRHGYYGKVLNAWIPYWNPQVQGLSKVIRSVTTSPDGKHIIAAASKVFGKAALSQILPEAILHVVLKAIGKYDDWEELDDRTKASYYCIPLAEEHRFLKIPKSREWSAIIGNPFMQMLEGASGRVDPMKNWVETSFVPNFLPSGITDAFPFKYIYDFAKNRDYAGRRIESYEMEGDKLKAKDKWTTETSYFGRLLGGILDDAISPIQIDYIIRDYFGDFGKVFTLALSEATLYGDDSIWDEAGRIITQAWTADNRRNNQTVSDYYDALTELEQEVNNIAVHQGKEAKEESEAYQIQQAVNKAYGADITALNKQVRGMNDGEEKRELQGQIAELAADALAYLDLLKGGAIKEPLLTLDYEDRGLSKALTDELIRFDKFSKDFNFKPTGSAPKSYVDPNAKGYEYLLTDAQKAHYEDLYNQIYNAEMTALIRSPEYRSATELEKLEMLGDVKSDVSTMTKEQLIDWLESMGVESTPKRTQDEAYKELSRS